VYSFKNLIFLIFSYVEWSLHEPYSGVYNFEGQADVEHFLTISKQENMNVLIRPGPFISAERDLVSINLSVKNSVNSNSMMIYEFIFLCIFFDKEIMVIYISILLIELWYVYLIYHENISLI